MGVPPVHHFIQETRIRDSNSDIRLIFRLVLPLTFMCIFLGALRLRLLALRLLVLPPAGA